MRISGSRTLDAPRAAVFAAILDPSTLLAVIPGCHQIEQTDDAEYRGLISLRLPGMVGSYRTVVRLVESDAPCGGRLEGQVVGTPGSITGRASFRLTEAGERATTVEYEGQAVIGGPLARLDGRFVEGIAGSLIGQGLDNLGARLQAEARRRIASDDMEIEGRPAIKETSA